jgi:hypothetical protein
MDGAARISVAENERARSSRIVGVVFQDLSLGERGHQLLVEDLPASGLNAGVLGHGPLARLASSTDGINGYGRGRHNARQYRR